MLEDLFTNAEFFHVIQGIEVLILTNWKQTLPSNCKRFLG